VFVFFTGWMHPRPLLLSPFRTYYQLGRAILNEQGTVNVRDCSFDNHHIYSDGAAILNYANMTIKNSTFSGNQAWYSWGGAISNEDGAMAIESSSFSGNKAEHGGAIYARGPPSKMTIEATKFVGNIATKNGGAIRQYKSNLEVSRSTFEANVAKGGYGGAFGVYDNRRLVVSNNVFVANKDKTGAGAVYLVEKSNCTMQGNNFTDNTSGGSEVVSDAVACTHNAKLRRKNALTLLLCWSDGRRIQNMWPRRTMHLNLSALRATHSTLPKTSLSFPRNVT